MFTLNFVTMTDEEEEMHRFTTLEYPCWQHRNYRDKFSNIAKSFNQRPQLWIYIVNLETSDHKILTQLDRVHVPMSAPVRQKYCRKSLWNIFVAVILIYVLEVKMNTGLFKTINQHIVNNNKVFHLLFLIFT